MKRESCGQDVLYEKIQKQNVTLKRKSKRVVLEIWKTKCQGSKNYVDGKE